MLAWNDVKDEFVWEGSLRDVCLPETTISDWRIVWRMLCSGRLDITYTVDGVTTAPPEDVAQIFAVPRDQTYLLAIRFAGVQLNCHFFDDSEIELDLDPREIHGQEQLNALVSFMAELATATGHVALMTPENMHDSAFLRVRSSDVIEYISTGGLFVEAANQHEQVRAKHSPKGNSSA